MILVALLFLSGTQAAAITAAAPSAAAAATTAAARANEAFPASDYTHAHTLLTVEGGRRLNLFCSGTGSPTVIYEAGAGEDSASFRRVQKRLSRLTRVCSYDRAGLGFSDAAPRASSAENIVADLHRLIEHAAIQRPVVLAGHSNGGLYAMLYAATYPADVAGMLLIDPSFVGQDRALTARWTRAQRTAWHAEDSQDIEQTRHCLALAQQGLLAQPGHQDSPCLDNPPDADAAFHRELDRQLARPQEQSALLSEMLDTFPSAGTGLSRAEAALQNAHFDFGSKPLIVLTAGRQFASLPPKQRAEAFAAWKKGHDDEAARSSKGLNIVVPRTSHFIQWDRPEVVVQAAGRVVRDVRMSRP